MLPFFRLIRIPNLFIVALTQAIIYFHLIIPHFETYQIEPALPVKEFLFFILVTVLITAGGYIINDILDYDTDIINKDAAVVLNKNISFQTATWLYLSTSALGFFIAIYLAFFIGKLELVTIYPIAIGSLFMYSKYLKKMPLVGNLIIAVFAAGVAGIVGFAENEGLDKLIELNPALSWKIFIILWAYMLFAFYSTLFREVVKDIEDIKGDVSLQFRTLPILIGIPKAKKLSMIFGISLLLMIITGGWIAWPIITFWGKIIILPLLLTANIWALFSLNKAQKKEDFNNVSQLTKLVMLAGVLLLLTLTIP